MQIITLCSNSDQSSFRYDMQEQVDDWEQSFTEDYGYAPRIKDVKLTCNDRFVFMVVLFDGDPPPTEKVELER